MAAPSATSAQEQPVALGEAKPAKADWYGLDLTEITEPELRESFAPCRRIHQQALHASYLAVDILSARNHRRSIRAPHT